MLENTIYGAGRLGVRKSDGTHLYQLTDHLGNVRAVVGRNPQGQAMALTTATDYYPFGMPMPGRDLKGDYRYAYQGQEKDTETGKEAFELRLWDSRIGRWLTTDPYGQFASPYLGMGNNPITGVDSDGGCVDGNGNPCPQGEFEGQLNADFAGNVWKWEDGTYNTTNPIALDEVILGGASKYDIVMADMKSEWMADFYRGRSELSMGVIELMFNVTTTALTFGEGAAVLGSLKGLTSASSSRFVYHSTSRSGAAQNIVKGINPKFFNPASRFGKGFYVGESVGTTVAELGYHGASRVNTIQYTMQGAKLLDATGSVLNLGTKYAPKLLSKTAQALKYDGIIFNSLRSRGTNTVLFKNFGALKNARIIF